MPDFLSTPGLIFALALLAAFVAAFVLVARAAFRTAFAGRGGGWAALQARYRAGAAPEGKAWPRQTVQVGRVTWKNCVRAIVARDGLYLECRAPLGLGAGREPLLIPWHDLRHAGELRRPFGSAVLFEVGDPPVTTVVLPAPIAEAVAAGRPVALHA